MPLYDFICNACKEKFEILIMGSDRPSCPNCGSHDLAKQMSTFAFRSSGRDTSAEASSSSSKCGGCTAGSCSTCH